jgi:hypothetical protein
MSKQIKFSDLSYGLQSCILLIFVITLFVITFIAWGNGIDNKIKDLPHKSCHNESIYKDQIDFSGGTIHHYYCNGGSGEFGVDNYTETWRSHYESWSDWRCDNNTCYIYSNGCGLVGILVRGENDTILHRQVYDGEKEVCEIK